MKPDPIFDRSTRRKARDRAALSSSEDRWLIRMMAENVVDRLSDQKDVPARALLVGLGMSTPILDWFENHGVGFVCCDPGPSFARQYGGVQADEDRLPFADASFDLVIYCGTLDTVDDLPGAFLLSHRVLRPGGRIVGSIVGGPSLSVFKAKLMAAEISSGAEARSRFHPQLEIRAIGDLLLRAGFVMPIVDSDSVNVRYSGIPKLVSDLRSAGLTNVLANRSTLCSGTYKSVVRAAPHSFEDTFTLLNMVAWKAADGEIIRVGPSGRYAGVAL